MKSCCRMAKLNDIVPAGLLRFLVPLIAELFSWCVSYKCSSIVNPSLTGMQYVLLISNVFRQYIFIWNQAYFASISWFSFIEIIMIVFYAQEICMFNITENSSGSSEISSRYLAESVMLPSLARFAILFRQIKIFLAI